MKSATIPSLRVTPELRENAESVLRDGESLSSFVEASLRAQIEHRKFQQDFITRAMTARDRAKDTGEYVAKDDVISSLKKIAEVTSDQQ